MAAVFRNPRCRHLEKHTSGWTTITRPSNRTSSTFNTTIRLYSTWTTCYPSRAGIPSRPCVGLSVRTPGTAPGTRGLTSPAADRQTRRLYRSLYRSLCRWWWRSWRVRTNGMRCIAYCIDIIIIIILVVNIWERCDWTRPNERPMRFIRTSVLRRCIWRHQRVSRVRLRVRSWWWRVDLRRPIGAENGRELMKRRLLLSRRRSYTRCRRYKSKIIKYSTRWVLHDSERNASHTIA